MSSKLFFLVGMMGSGKSSIAKNFEDSLKCIDTDLEIEKITGLSVSEIFETKGELYFRQLEKVKLESILTSQITCLVSCGGGFPCFNNNMDLMKKHGTVIYLKCSIAVLVNRLLQNTATRPLLKHSNAVSLINDLESVLGKREAVYQQAHYVIDASLNIEEVFAQIKNITDL